MNSDRWKTLSITAPIYNQVNDGVGFRLGIRSIPYYIGYDVYKAMKWQSTTHGVSPKIVDKSESLVNNKI